MQYLIRGFCFNKFFCSFVPDKEFSGTEKWAGQQPRSGPVQFEKDGPREPADQVNIISRVNTFDCGLCFIIFFRRVTLEAPMPILIRSAWIVSCPLSKGPTRFPTHLRRRRRLRLHRVANETITKTRTVIPTKKADETNVVNFFLISVYVFLFLLNCKKLITHNKLCLIQYFYFILWNIT